MAMGLVAGFILHGRVAAATERLSVVVMPMGSAILYTMLACALLSGNVWGGVRTLILMRCASGFWAGFQQYVVSTMCREAMPSSEQVPFSIVEYAAVACGRCLGPLLSSLMSLGISKSSDVPCSAAFESGARAFLAVAGMCAVLSLLVSLCVPPDQRVVRKQSPESDVESADDFGIPLNWPVTVAFLSFVQMFLIVFSYSGVEISAPLILQLDYGWESRRIGFGFAAVFGATAALALLLLAAKAIFEKWDYGVIVFTSMGATVSTAAMLDFGAGGPWQLLGACGLAYSLLVCLSGTIDGFLYIAVGTMFPVASINFVLLLVEPIAEAVSAPLVRLAVVVLGRNRYVIAQLVVVALLSAAAIRIAAWATTSSDKDQKKLETKPVKSTMRGG
eukprot:gnl/TRDRNA2_/TRDRNA2_84814_c0_seq1.p1 gnl/TRDRNA2_/TRDRNA2_84814_c0~~gnl/TRDRNA2_/TRDRNA2_84814_c0_seq1.p1  ORF type:complete len:440 (+),score=61.19 gnl/TRDRNA2_/TRDRNA2_84814_c0_seq1:153-1322(+)